MKTDEQIANTIYTIRGHKVMLDRDRAELYEVETRSLNQAVKRNISRFPGDFMFQLTKDEYDSLRSQFVILKKAEKPQTGKHTKYLPYAFTEQGVAMLSSVLSSERAIQVNIQIMRMFTRLRAMLSTHEDLRRKIESMEKKYDEQFGIVFRAIKRLLSDDAKPKRKIGFVNTTEKNT
ncbi:MAG TPA: ORF6N domain-containing protein [Spirochaetota bacterium]|nr:ORF6N domain-containing protein [Spirochaetota bacterium]